MKPKKFRLPLRAHLAIGFLIFSALLLVVLWLFQTVFLESFYKAVKTGQVKSCAYSLADYIETDSFEDIVADIEEQNDMIVGVYNTESSEITSVYTSVSQPGFQSDVSMKTVHTLYEKAIINGGETSSITKVKYEERSMKPDVIKRFAQEQSGSESGADQNDQNAPFQSGSFDAPPADQNNSATEASADPDEDLSDFRPEKRKPDLERETNEILVFSKVVNTSQGERLIIVESIINPVASVVGTLRYQLFIMTAVIIVVSIIIAFIVARLIAKPIANTTEKAKSLARQDYDVKFSGGRYREITELNSTLNFAASELKKVDSLQKELIANISHDLRTPLTMITGYSEVMRDLPGEMTPENIQIIIDEATRLNSLVTDLLDISRLQSGTADIKSEPFSLTKCVEGIFERYNKLRESEGLNIIFEHDGEVFIMGDELRMTQVLYNLVNNAVNYVGEDNTVIVRQTVLDEKVKIEVIDHGAGIPEDQLEYIWDRYYRVDKEHRRAKIGTGLGLSIVKNILLAHNAEFGVESKLGEGSDFWFIIPIIPTGDD